MLSDPVDRDKTEAADRGIPQPESPKSGVVGPVGTSQSIEEAVLGVVDAESKKQEQVAKLEAKTIAALKVFNPALKNLMKKEKTFWDAHPDFNANDNNDKQILISHFILLDNNLKHLEESLALVESDLGRNISTIIRYVIKTMELYAAEVLKVTDKDQVDTQKLGFALKKFNDFRIEKFGEFVSVVNLLSTDMFTQDSLKGHFEYGVVNELFNALKVPAIPENLLFEYKTQKDNEGKMDLSDFNVKYEKALKENPEQDESSLRWKMFELLLPSAGEKRLSLDFVSQLFDAIKKYKKEKFFN
jgi:hypothetical protein